MGFQVKLRHPLGARQGSHDLTISTTQTPSLGAVAPGVYHTRTALYCDHQFDRHFVLSLS